MLDLVHSALAGEAEVGRPVCERPQAILANADPATIPSPEVSPPVTTRRTRRGLLGRQNAELVEREALGNVITPARA